MPRRPHQLPGLVPGRSHDPTKRERDGTMPPSDLYAGVVQAGEADDVQPFTRPKTPEEIFSFLNDYARTWDEEHDTRWPDTHARTPNADAAEQTYVVKREEARRVLGVSKFANADEIKAAWREKVRLCHPDLHPGVSYDQIKAVNHARDVLEGKA
jgi:hypothetical protein